MCRNFFRHMMCNKAASSSGSSTFLTQLGQIPAFKIPGSLARSLDHDHVTDASDVEPRSLDVEVFGMMDMHSY